MGGADKEEFPPLLPAGFLRSTRLAASAFALKDSRVPSLDPAYCEILKG